MAMRMLSWSSDTTCSHCSMLMHDSEGEEKIKTQTKAQTQSNISQLGKKTFFFLNIYLKDHVHTLLIEFLGLVWANHSTGKSYVSFPSYYLEMLLVSNVPGFPIFSLSKVNVFSQIAHFCYTKDIHILPMPFSIIKDKFEWRLLAAKGTDLRSL